MVKEMEKWHRYCKEKGVEYKPRSPEEMEKISDRIVDMLEARWVRLKNLRDLAKDVVVQSYALKYGEKVRLKDGREAVKIGSYKTVSEDSEGCDESRRDALFVIEELKVEKRFYRPWTKVTILLRRLNADETYNSDGELLVVEETLGERPWQAEPVGQMNFDRTAMTYTLPRK